MTTPTQPPTPDRDSPALAGPYAPGRPMPTDEQIIAYCNMERYLSGAARDTNDGSSIEERAAIAVRFVRAAVAEPGGKAETGVTDIMVCKLPYQDHWFVHGARAGTDVWLRRDGSWSTEDGDPQCALPANPHLASVPASPPAPQPEAATGERPCRKCQEPIYDIACPACGRKCYTDGGAWIGPPPPTVETAEGWRSVPLVVLPTRVDEQTAPTVTLPLADAQGLLHFIDCTFGPGLKPAIVLREAIERAKP